MKKEPKSYLEKTRYFPPTGILYQVIFSQNKYHKRALDLGCGSLRDSKFLVFCGYVVDAVDINPLVKKYFDKWVKYLPKNVVRLYITNVNDFHFQKKYYDIINAQNVFTFIPKIKVNKLLGKINNSLKKNGVFIGNFIGTDDWSAKIKPHKNISFYSKEEVKNLLKNFKLISFKEKKGKGLDVDGIKRNIHEIIFIARKK